MLMPNLSAFQYLLLVGNNAQIENTVIPAFYHKCIATIHYLS